MRHADFGQRRRRWYRNGASGKSSNFALQVVLLSIFVAIICWQAAPQVQALISGATESPQTIRAREASVYYYRCAEARAAGAAPIYRGQPGYREGLDGDSDGIACEPIRY